MVGSQVVGRYTSQGVLANVDQDSGAPSGDTIDDDAPYYCTIHPKMTGKVVVQ